MWESDLTGSWTEWGLRSAEVTGKGAQTKGLRWEAGLWALWWDKKAEGPGAHPDS